MRNIFIVFAMVGCFMAMGCSQDSMTMGQMDGGMDGGIDANLPIYETSPIPIIAVSQSTPDTQYGTTPENGIDGIINETNVYVPPDSSTINPEVIFQGVQGCYYKITLPDNVTVHGVKIFLRPLITFPRIMVWFFSVDPATNYIPVYPGPYYLYTSNTMTGGIIDLNHIDRQFKYIYIQVINSNIPLDFYEVQVY